MLKKGMMTLKKLLLTAILVAGWNGTALAQPAATVDFEDLVLASEFYWNGSDNSSSFTSRGVQFNNYYDNTYGPYWEGFAYSNTTDITTSGHDGQYNVIAGSGAAGSPTYAIGYIGFMGTTPASVLPIEQSVSGMYVTNNNFTYYSMLEGDDFAKKFGGDSGDDPDWYLLAITGKSDNGTDTGSVEFYLADYRFEDNSQDYIVDEWTWVDLESLGSVKLLEFTLSSSDTGEWGMNTPAYFAMDNLNESCVCGNGNLDHCEECDDGNAQDGDGCSAACQIENQTSGGDSGSSGGSGGSGSPANKKPVIDAVHTEQLEGYTVLFSVEAHDPDGNIAAYLWQFSDSLTISTPSTNISHTFTAPGYYNVSLTVKDNNEGETSQLLTVDVAEPETPAPEEEPECINDADCDDGGFCNGVEQCIDGKCEAGNVPCDEDEVCMEDDQQCWTKETVEALSLKDQLHRPLIFNKRCTRLVLNAAGDNHFSPDESIITLLGPAEAAAGVMLDSKSSAFEAWGYILVPVCIEKGAEAGEWTLEIVTEYTDNSKTIEETITSNFVIN